MCKNTQIKVTLMQSLRLKFTCFHQCPQVCVKSYRNCVLVKVPHGCVKSHTKQARKSSTQMCKIYWQCPSIGRVKYVKTIYPLRQPIQAVLHTTDSSMLLPVFGLANSSTIEDWTASSALFQGSRTIGVWEATVSAVNFNFHLFYIETYVGYKKHLRKYWNLV